MATKLGKETLTDKVLEEILPRLKLPKRTVRKEYQYKSVNDIYDIAKEMKYKHKFRVRNKENIRYIENEPVLSINWHFYKQLLVKAGKEWLIAKYDLEYFMDEYDELKKISNWCLTNAPKDYYYVVNIETLYGWKIFKDVDEIKKKLKNWINNDFEPNYNGSKKLFNEKFKDNLRKLFKIHGKPDNIKTSTPEEFVSDIPNTSTTGSAYDPDGTKPYVTVDDEQIKLKSSKFAKSAQLSIEKKLKRLLKKKKFKSSVSVKVEFYPKVRLIVSSDFDSNLKMTYVNTWFDKFLRSSNFTTLFQDREQTSEMWISFINDSKMYKVPTDQSAFDHKITKQNILDYNRVKLEVMKEYCDNPEIIKVQETIIYGLKHSTVIYENEEYEWKSGLTSGLKITAEAGSIINYVQNMTAIQLLNEGYNQNVNQYSLYVQGDDVMSKFESLYESMLYIASMRSMGYDIHPAKTFISKTHNEFLRKYSFEDKINGYPARIINNLLWVYPGEFEQKSVIQKMTSTIDNWVKLAQRLYIEIKDIMGYIKDDMKGGKIPKKLFNAYKTTRRVFGGMQYEKGNSYEWNKIPGEFTKRVDIDLKGYTEFREIFGKYQEREMNEWVIKMLNIENSKFGFEDNPSIELHEIDKVKELSFRFIPSQTNETIEPIIPGNVLFGSNQQFMEHTFPGIRSFVTRAKAPKSWMYDYLLGRVKPIVPIIKNKSIEFSSYFYKKYEASLLNAMMFKSSKIQNKWLRLNEFAINNFDSYIKTIVNPTIYNCKMY